MFELEMSCEWLVHRIAKWVRDLGSTVDFGQFPLRPTKTKKERKQFWVVQSIQSSSVGDVFPEKQFLPAFRVSTGLHVEHRRPAMLHIKDLLKGFRFQVSGLGVSGFRVQGFWF